MVTQSNTRTKVYAPIGVRAKSQQIHYNSILPRTRKPHYKNETKQRLISIEAENISPKVQPANPKHQFLTDNKLQPHSLRQLHEKLVVPLIDISGHIWSLAYINAQGNIEHMGGRNGLFSVLSNSEVPEQIFTTAEWKTAARISQGAANCAVFCSMTSHNLYTVALSIRHKCRKVLLDVKPKSNPRRACNAAKAVGGVVVTEYEIEGIK